MNELFIFVSLMLTSYLLLGCLLVALVSMLLRIFTLNAATRHNIWLLLLLVLVSMPALSFFPSPVMNSPTAILPTDSIKGARATTGQVLLPTDAFGEAANTLPKSGLLQLDAAHERALIIPTKLSYLKNLSVNTLAALPLYWFGIAFTLLIAIGITLRLLLFIQSYRALRILFQSSESADEKWLVTLARLSSEMEVRKNLVLTHSTLIDTPSTSGVLNPWIILPTALMENKKSPQFLEQILQHELAHIKRRDPFVASMQAIISIFLFWHPAVNYVNKQIRFERELACDDWVINQVGRDGVDRVRAYANSLLNIAESLQRQVSLNHSVACVHTTHGLVSRIKTLLDKNADHSTSMKLTSSALISCLALASLVFSSPMWPKFPNMSQQQVAEEPALTPLIDQAIANSNSMEVEETPATSDSVSLVYEFVSWPDQSDEIPLTAAISNSIQKPIELSVTEMIDEGPGSEADTAIEKAEDAVIEVLVSVNTVPNKDNLDLASGISQVVIEKNIEPVLLSDEPTVQPWITIVDALEAPFSNSSASKPIEISTIAPENDPVENEFIVIDDFSRSELKAEILKVEFEFYRAFNKVTQKEQFRMYCESYIPLGSYIKRPICEPQFLRQARNENVRDHLSSNGLLLASGALRADLDSEYEELAEELVAELRENGYLLELYNVLAMLRGRLDELNSA